MAFRYLFFFFHSFRQVDARITSTHVNGTYLLTQTSSMHAMCDADEVNYVLVKKNAKLLVTDKRIILISDFCVALKVEMCSTKCQTNCVAFFNVICLFRCEITAMNSCNELINWSIWNFFLNGRKLKE